MTKRSKRLADYMYDGMKEITFYGYTKDGQFFQANAFYVDPSIGVKNRRPVPADLDGVQWFTTINKAAKDYRKRNKIDLRFRDGKRPE